jgi:hypothetical protein
VSIESPYETPKSSLVDVDNCNISRKGRYAVLKPDIEWPSRCFKCNQETSLRKEVKLTYLNPWIYISILFTILLTIILALIFRKRFTVNLPLCELHIKKRKKFLIFQWALVAVMSISIFIGVLSTIDVLVLLSIVTFLVILISAIFGRLAFAAKYTNGNLWITGAGKEFLNNLPDFVA